MKKILCSLIAILVSAAVALAGSAVAQTKQQLKSEDEIGLRKETTLYDESKAMPAHGEYGNAAPGKSKPLGRAFENSPPLIPHDLTGMLPIAATNNSCLNCHMPEHAGALGATPMPKSHFFDIDSGRDLQGKMDNKRFECMECHVPQVNIPEAIKNTFKADFRSKQSKTRSNLLDTLNEGVRAD